MHAEALEYDRSDEEKQLEMFLDFIFQIKNLIILRRRKILLI